MFRFVLICLFLSFVCNVTAARAQQAIKAKPSTSSMYSEINIAFGSNFFPNLTKEVNVFDKILQTKPDLFIWLGETLSDNSRGSQYSKQLTKLKERADYSNLARQVAITGVEDLSHASSEIRSVYLKFLDEDPASSRIKSLELYKSYWIESNPISTHSSISPKRVKLLVLDVNILDERSEVISPNQFAWLEEELQQKADNHFLTILASGYQILPNDKSYEYALDIEAKVKLLKLIKKSPVPVLLMSGASFYSFGEVMNFPCSVEEDLGYNLYEITSSGLNSNDHEKIEFYNKFLVGQTFSKLKNRVYEPHFGHIKIVYNHMTQDSEAFLELINEEGKKLVSVRADYSKIKERKKHIKEVEDDLSLCSLHVYSSDSTLKSLITNIPHLLSDPNMRLYAIAGILAMFGLFLGCLFNGLKLMNGQRGAGGGRSYSWGGGSFHGLDEYERYHMD